MASRRKQPPLYSALPTQPSTDKSEHEPPRLDILHDLDSRRFSESFSGYTLDDDFSTEQDTGDMVIGDGADVSYNIKRYSSTEALKSGWRDDDIEEVVVMSSKSRPLRSSSETESPPASPSTRSRISQGLYTIPEISDGSTISSFGTDDLLQKKGNKGLKASENEQQYQVLTFPASPSQNGTCSICRRVSALKSCSHDSSGLLDVLKTMNEKLLDEHYLAKIRAVFRDDGAWKVLLDYHDPESTLLNFLSRLGVLMNPGQTRIYAAELLLAISSLHSVGIFHCSINPSNIVVDSAGHILLTGFNSACLVDPNRHSSSCEDRRLSRMRSHQSLRSGRSNSAFLMAMGDTEPENADGLSVFMAPEVLLGWTQDEKVDVWGFGVVLWCLSVGIAPFYDASMGNAGENAKSPSLTMLSGSTKFSGSAGAHFEPDFDNVCDPVLADLLSKCLEMNPAVRISLEDVARHDWFTGIEWELVKYKEHDLLHPFLASLGHTRSLIAATLALPSSSSLTLIQRRSMDCGRLVASTKSPIIPQSTPLDITVSPRLTASSPMLSTSKASPNSPSFSTSQQSTTVVSPLSQSSSVLRSDSRFSSALPTNTQEKEKAKERMTLFFDTLDAEDRLRQHKSLSRSMSTLFFSPKSFTSFTFTAPLASLSMFGGDDTPGTRTDQERRKLRKPRSSAHLDRFEGRKDIGKPYKLSSKTCFAHGKNDAKNALKRSISAPALLSTTLDPQVSLTAIEPWTKEKDIKFPHGIEHIGDGIGFTYRLPSASWSKASICTNSNITSKSLKRRLSQVFRTVRRFGSGKFALRRKDEREKVDLLEGGEVHGGKGGLALGVSGRESDERRLHKALMGDLYVNGTRSPKAAPAPTYERLQACRRPQHQARSQHVEDSPLSDSGPLTPDSGIGNVFVVRDEQQVVQASGGAVAYLKRRPTLRLVNRDPGLRLSIPSIPSDEE